MTYGTIVRRRGSPPEVEYFFHQCLWSTALSNAADRFVCRAWTKCGFHTLKLKSGSPGVAMRSTPAGSLSGTGRRQTRLRMEALSPPRRPRPTTPEARDQSKSKFQGEAITNVLVLHQNEERARQDAERKAKLSQRQNARQKVRNPYDRFLENQEAEWGRKKDRRSAVVSLLRSVCEQLRKNKNAPLSRDAEALGLTNSCQPKYALSTFKGKLSWRGAELCATLFDAFDGDNDKRWTYSDFRRYLEAVGRPAEFEAVVLDSSESFRCYFDDLYGTDERNLIGLEHFRNYRECIEDVHPVEKDVLACGLSASPQVLEAWRAVRKTWDALIAFGAHPLVVSIRRALPMEQAEERPPHTLPAAMFRQLCHDSGLTLMAEEAAKLWHVHTRKNALMVEIRTEYKYKHRFGFHQLSHVDSDPSLIYRDAFIGWWFAGRPLLPTAPRGAGAVLGLRRMLRRVLTTGNACYTRVKRAVDRGLLARLGLVKDDLATLDLSLATGDEGKDLQDEEGRLGVEIDVEHGEDATSTKAKLQVPSQSGASLNLDFPCREDADEDDLRRFKKRLKVVLEQYVVPPLQELTPGFHTVRVIKVMPYTPPDDPAKPKPKAKKAKKVEVEEADDEPEVIRVQFLWKNELNADAFLRRRVGLGLGLKALVPEFAWSLRCATSLEDLLDNTRVSLGAPDFSLRMSLHAIYARKVLHRVGEEVLHALDEEADLLKAARESSAMAHERAVRRSVESHGALLKDGERPIAGITGHAAPAQTASAVREEHDASEANATRNVLWTCVRWLGATKAQKLDFVFRDLREGILGSPAILALVPAAWLPSLKQLLDKGGVAKLWSRWRTSAEAELGGLWREVEDVEGAIQARAEAIVQAEKDAWAALTEDERTRRRFEQEKKALQDKILRADIEAANRKLGIEPEKKKKKKKREGEESEEEEPPEDEGEVEFGRRLRKRHSKTVRRVLEMYRLATAVLYGCSSVTLHSNATKVEISLEGLDFFAELP